MQFLVEMCLGSRSPQKAITFSLFLVFKRKCVKMASQMGGQIAPKNRIFSHWSPFGCPWVHFLDFWAPLVPTLNYSSRITQFIRLPISVPLPLYADRVATAMPISSTTLHRDREAERQPEELVADGDGVVVPGVRRLRGL